MNAYLVYQTQQMERARTFAEIRRIDERVSAKVLARSICCIWSTR